MICFSLASFCCFRYFTGLSVLLSVRRVAPAPLPIPAAPPIDPRMPPFLAWGIGRPSDPDPWLARFWFWLVDDAAPPLPPPRGCGERLR